MNSILTPRLKQLLREQFQLDWDDIHGGSHWERVRENGLRLAEINGADTRIIELFAWFHDARRQNDGHDPEHGERGGELARTLCGVEFQLPSAALDLLVIACELHDRGLATGNLTILTCWDADRLDLGRVGILPNPTRLGTVAARQPEILAWANQRSSGSRLNDRSPRFRLVR